jgi:hypothetical protein
MSNNAVKHYCVTHNNYDDTDYQRYIALYPSKISYIVIGKEVGDSGTPHLQIYFRSAKKVRFSVVKKWLLPASPHIEAAIDPPSAADYCKKDGDYEELGSFTQERQRSDIIEFRDFVKDGNRDRKRILEEYPEIVAKYPRFVKECCDAYRPVYKLPSYELHPWQSSLNNVLKLPANSREIIFVVDTTGNTGKSWFADYFCSLHDNAQVLEMGKKADVAYAINPECRVFFFDITREINEYMNYSVLEALKNGRIFSSKYDSCMTRLTTIPHVVVLMNQHPDMSKLSLDRYKIINL